jgi:uroporphyrin-III C-methyltransferase
MTGIVYLVGAGPGAPDLISLRGIRVLRQADVILCDNLLPRSFLDHIGVSTQDKNVIWRGEDVHAMRQEKINRILCEEAGKGLVVARLKNGDPLIFGRASEEIAALNEHGIPWVVVPGISSCSAAPAGAGLMLTDRGDSRSFTVSSAVCVGGIPNEDYPVTDSLALLMGVKSLDAVAARLIDNGWPPDTPVAIIERASLPFERHVSSTLSHIVEVAAAAAINPPGVVLLGKAALSKSGADRKRILFTGLDPSGFLGLGGGSTAALASIKRSDPRIGSGRVCRRFFRTEATLFYDRNLQRKTGGNSVFPGNTKRGDGCAAAGRNADCCCGTKHRAGVGGAGNPSGCCLPQRCCP